MPKEQLYEMVVIFDARGEDADIRNEFDVVQTLVEKHSSKFLGRAEWGLKNFAYPIRKQTAGHYLYFLFKAGVDVPGEISATLKMNEKVLRHLIVKAKPNAVEYLSDVQSKLAERIAEEKEVDTTGEPPASIEESDEPKSVSESATEENIAESESAVESDDAVKENVEQPPAESESEPTIDGDEDVARE